MKLLPMVALAGLAFYAYRYLNTAGAARRRAAPARPSDTLIAQRVRKRLAKLAAPDSFQVSAHEGTITLRGTAAPGARDRLLREALAVPGVSTVVNRLDVRGGRQDEIPDEGAFGQPFA
jgi:osmotically-inducible protein OsmY